MWSTCNSTDGSFAGDAPQNLHLKLSRCITTKRNRRFISLVVLCIDWGGLVFIYASSGTYCWIDFSEAWCFPLSLETEFCSFLSAFTQLIKASNAPLHPPKCREYVFSVYLDNPLFMSVAVGCLPS